MFYNIIKNFFLKKNVTKRLTSENSFASNEKVITVGILVDESYFSETNQLIERIVSQGIDANNISVLVYKDKIKKKEEINEPFLTIKNISLSGEITKPEVKDFIETPFDLLLNYYDVSKSSLLLLSVKSKAKFKVGFDTVDKRVNHFIIKSLVENFNEFVLELFKYLKILNKI
ncbi:MULTISPECIES: hypothetical protein [unclassified Flavobacterium]|uniref:DUF6913 domain-containing protein n=1 Tax=unclassified Flavobacterium TaxID=196869 RepID=UPI0012909638|nr:MULTISPECIES: hypothetical protein [unclassified Flavobacterium]MQP52539.1 hypothetical protein [Flavobacterium sp. LMO9]MQP62609.1 hypothetical protein [Flavobacterium sp. LMO6]